MQLFIHHLSQQDEKKSPSIPQPPSGKIKSLKPLPIENLLAANSYSLNEYSSLTAKHWNKLVSMQKIKKIQTPSNSKLMNDLMTVDFAWASLCSHHPLGFPSSFYSLRLLLYSATMSWFKLVWFVWKYVWFSEAFQVCLVPWTLSLCVIWHAWYFMKNIWNLKITKTAMVGMIIWKVWSEHCVMRHVEPNIWRLNIENTSYYAHHVTHIHATLFIIHSIPLSICN